MNKLPNDIFDFIVDKTVRDSSLAYFIVDNDGKLKDWDMEVSLYLKSIPNKGEPVTDCLSFLEGYFPIRTDELHIPSIETPSGLMADVYLIRRNNLIYVILLDKTYFKEKIQKVLQNSNEKKLTLSRYSNLKDDILVFDVSAFLGLLILESIGSNEYNLIGLIPKWVDFIADSEGKKIEEKVLIERFPFIEYFLGNAKEFWRNNNRGKLNSDLWVETDNFGKEVYLEAKAINLRNRDFLLIEYGHSSADEKFKLIQRARELKLEHELRLKAEETLSKQNKKLNELNATKDKFFSIIAHDLRNPLAAFRNIVELLTNFYDELSEDKIKNTIRILDDNSNHLYKLLENLLQWSQSQTGGIQFLPVLQSVSAVVHINASLMEVAAEKKNISIEYNIDDDLMAYYDADLTNTVLRNLIMNAIKFTKLGGKITIEAKDLGDLVEICVKDNGVGMNKEDLEKLFRIDVHHTTLGTSEEKGTGLGLILCKEFIAMHKCKIYAESREGEGSSFIFTLPKNHL